MIRSLLAMRTTGWAQSSTGQACTSQKMQPEVSISRMVLPLQTGISSHNETGIMHTVGIAKERRRSLGRLAELQVKFLRADGYR